MEILPGFDYHLVPKEQQQLERIVPLHQAKIHLAFRSNVKINGKISSDCVIALSEHMVTVCSHGFIGKSLKLMMAFHLFDIIGFRTISDEIMEIEIPDNSLVIQSTISMRFSRNLLRNFLLSNPMLPHNLRFPFSCHDSRHFPPFSPTLSPSQQFQFTYNAFCSFYDSAYFHDIPRYYHSLMTTGNAIFDLNKLPMHILEANFGEAMSIRPIFSSLMFCPYVFGVVCNNVTRPDIFKSIAPMILCNQNLRILKLCENRAENGCDEIANSIINSKNSRVLYWDFSGNSLKDIEFFTHALCKYYVPIRSLKFDFCHMNGKSIGFLFQALLQNDDLHNLEQLSIVGNTISSDNSNLFSGYIKRLSSLSNPPLNYLGFGPISSINNVLDSLSKSTIQLETLRIYDSVFDEKCIENMVDIISRSSKLKNIDLSRCTITDNGLKSLFETIGSNPSISTICLSMARMKLNGKRLRFILGHIDTILSSKIEFLNLDHNSMGVEDLASLVLIMPHLAKLKVLSLSYNFGSKLKGIGQKLVELVNGPSLDTIIIKGKHNKRLKSEAIPFICGLFSHSQIKSIDLSSNKIGDIGLSVSSNLVSTSPNICSFIVDGSEPTSFSSLEQFFASVLSNSSIYNSPFPIDDVYHLISSMKNKEKKRLIKLCSAYQQRIEIQLAKNRVVYGYHSDLSLVNDNVLDSLIDHVTIDLNEKLQKVRTHEHLAITSIVGLPLPYEMETAIENEIRGVPEPDSNMTIEYAEEKLMNKISEGLDETENSMKTLQFNSLCIRRPNAVQRLEKKARITSLDKMLSSGITESDEEESDVDTPIMPSVFDVDDTFMDDTNIE